MALPESQPAEKQICFVFDEIAQTPELLKGIRRRLIRTFVNPVKSRHINRSQWTRDVILQIVQAFTHRRNHNGFDG